MGYNFPQVKVKQLLNMSVPLMFLLLFSCIPGHLKALVIAVLGHNNGCLSYGTVSHCHLRLM